MQTITPSLKAEPHAILADEEAWLISHRSDTRGLLAVPSIRAVTEEEVERRLETIHLARSLYESLRADRSRVLAETAVKRDECRLQRDPDSHPGRP